MTIAGDRLERIARQVHRHAGGVAEQADGLDLGGRADQTTALHRPGSDAAGSDEVAGSQIVGHDAFELIGGVAVAVTDDDLVADEQAGFSAAGQLDARVLAFAHHPREHQIARPWGALGDQGVQVAAGYASAGEGRLGLGEALGMERFDRVAVNGPWCAW